MKGNASRKRWVCRAVLLLALSPGVALLCVNAALLVPKIRGKAISAVGKRIGLGGTADSLTYTPWGGIHMQAFRVGDGTLIRADSFSLDLEEAKLFSRVFSVKDIVLEGGTFTFLYRPPTQAPVVAALAPQKTLDRPVQNPQPPQTVARASPPPRTPAARAPSESGRDWSTAIGSVRVQNVRLAIRTQSEGSDLILAEGFNCDLPAGEKGRVRLEALMVAGHAVASGIGGDIARGEDNTIGISNLIGTVLGASLTGGLQIAPQRPGLPFAAEFGIEGLTNPQVNGTADATVSVQGGGTNPQSWRGQMQIQAPGKLSLVDFPSAEFIQTRFQAVIQDGTAQIVDARAIASGSGMLSLRASGHASLSGDIALNLRPYILSDALPATQKLTAPLFGGQAPQFALLPPSPLAFTDLAIRGNATDPQLIYSHEHPPLPLLKFLGDLRSPSPEN